MPELDYRAASQLGDIQGAVRAPNKFGSVQGRLAISIVSAAADADGHTQYPVNKITGSEPGTDFLCYGPSTCGICGRQGNGKNCAAVMKQQIRFSQHGAQQTGDLTNSAITFRAAKTMVNLLKMVRVDKYQTQGFMALLEFFGQTHEALLKLHTPG